MLDSEAGCAPQRAHADYVPRDLENLPDDGVCHGLPLGALIVLEDNTFFHVCPESDVNLNNRFYRWFRQMITVSWFCRMLSWEFDPCWCRVYP